MVKKNDFAKRAEDLLAARRAAVQELGELLETRNDQAAALADTDARIDKAITACLEAGWKPAELTEIGVPKTALPKRATRTATIEPRTPSADAPLAPADPQVGADGGQSPVHDQAPEPTS